MQLPEWLRTIFLITTGDGWPEADETSLWALSREWAGLSDAVDDLQVQLIEAVRAVWQNDWDGPAAEAFAVAGHEALDEGGPLPALVEGSQEMAAFVHDTGVNVQYTKIIVLEELVVLAGQIAYLVSTSWWTFGSSAATAAGLAAAGRSFAVAVVRQLAAAIAAGGAIDVGMDAATQLIQIARRMRGPWDEASTEATAIAGVVGGALGPVAHGAGQLLGGRLGHLVGDRAAEAARTIGISAGHEYTASGVTGVVTGEGWDGSTSNLTAGASAAAVETAGGSLQRRHAAAGAPVAPEVDLPGAQPQRVDSTAGDGPSDGVADGAVQPVPPQRVGSGVPQLTLTESNASSVGVDPTQPAPQALAPQAESTVPGVERVASVESTVPGAERVPSVEPVGHDVAPEAAETGGPVVMSRLGRALDLGREEASSFALTSPAASPGEVLRGTGAPDTPGRPTARSAVTEDRPAVGTTDQTGANALSRPNAISKPRTVRRVDRMKPSPPAEHGAGAGNEEHRAAQRA